jgi:hypothetical protein
MSSDESFLRDVVAALDRVELEAIVVGTVAAVLHGAPVMTQDLDLLIRDTPKNREKIAKLSAALQIAAPVEVSQLSRAIRPKDLAQLPILRETERVRRALKGGKST